ncbi:hepatic triacylglycerol lipase-like [Achroia grisella]|uniref:hepatic triacylglycerol lipase-like n=1 Tax=Achroia grisella TaxID=688607 RepID=UPI0027D2A3A4|nr:hepatic triacylglycerol lipase-like [Achroia grisella]
MKVLLVLAVFITLCASSAIPLVPGDNSNYIEGESRYIWMPDEEGVPRLVDLKEAADQTLLNTRHGANNQYWLLTRQNAGIYQILEHGDSNSIWNSNYDGSKPLVVVVHGFNSNGYSVLTMARAFFSVHDVNVIVVDWRTVANSNYVTAVSGVAEVGRFLGDFLNWLIEITGGDWNNVHLIGVSLGAHVVGSAGMQVGGISARVTGLDAAGPLWTGNTNALNSSAAQYVEVIHTDGGRLGIFNPIGDADFYPNGGRHPQPGCLTTMCSHIRAYTLFASSVITDHFQSSLCTDVEQAENVQCSGPVFNMGNGIFAKRGAGIYGLTTEDSWPY